MYFKDGAIWGKAITSLEPEKVFVMGQRAEIGFFDAKIINLAYCNSK